MKKIILLFLLISSNRIMAIENAATVSKKHLVGVTFGIQYHNLDDRMLNFKMNGYCGDIFYRYLFSHSTAVSKLYLTVNTGYTNYKNEGVRNEDISAALGMYFYRTSRVMLDWYCGIEVGALYRNAEETNNEIVLDTNSSDVKILAAITFGFIIPISESLHLDINLKDYYVFKDLKKNKLSVGLSYSF